MNSLDILSYYIWYVNFSVAGYVSGVDLEILGRSSLTTASGLLISHLSLMVTVGFYHSLIYKSFIMDN